MDNVFVYDNRNYAKMENLIDKPPGFKITTEKDEVIFSYCDTVAKFQYMNDGRIKPVSFPLAHHLLRICQDNDLLKTSNKIVAAMTSGPNKYCTVCAKRENISSSDIGYCSSCFDNYCYIVTGDDIMGAYKFDPLTLFFLIKTAIECIKSPNRDVTFEPFPKKYELIFKDFKTLCKVVAPYSEKKLYDIINTSNSEIDVHDKLGNELYGFIKFVLLTNNTYTRSERISNKHFFECDQNDDLLKIDNNTKFINFQVIHNPEKELAFKNCKPQYLVHGSSIGNWYSIMRNGLKNYSGTKMMSNGMAYGSGIYLSDNIQFSFAYSRKGTDDGLHVVAVLQVLGDLDLYKKAPNIYVVQDESKILLRYLILTNGKNLEAVQKYIMVERISELTSYRKNVTPILLKRLKQEVKNIEALPNKYPELSKLKITSSDDVLAINLGDKLETEIEIRVPDNYPLDPPSVRFTKPVADINSMVADNGIINLPELSFSKWNSKTKMSDIVLKVYNLLNTQKN
jgi:ubiquitin-protein ligase